MFQCRAYMIIDYLPVKVWSDKYQIGSALTFPYLSTIKRSCLWARLDNVNSAPTVTVKLLNIPRFIVTSKSFPIEHAVITRKRIAGLDWTNRDFSGITNIYLYIILPNLLYAGTTMMPPRVLALWGQNPAGTKIPKLRINTILQSCTFFTKYRDLKNFLNVDLVMIFNLQKTF